MNASGSSSDHQTDSLELEYEQLYRKYLLDLTVKEQSHDLSCMLELYLAIFAKHIYFDSRLTRDI